MMNGDSDKGTHRMWTARATCRDECRPVVTTCATETTCHAIGPGEGPEDGMGNMGNKPGNMTDNEPGDKLRMIPSYCDKPVNGMGKDQGNGTEQRPVQRPNTKTTNNAFTFIDKRR